jgi:hypothetical protein
VSATPTTWPVFNDAGIAATAISGAMPDLERRDALQSTHRWAYPRLFFGRPLQRGCRPAQCGHSVDAETDRVADVVPPAAGSWSSQGSWQNGLHGVGLRRSSPREFRFDRRLRASSEAPQRSDRTSRSFPYLPAGCHMELDRKASEIVLASLRSAIPDRWPQKVDELRSMAAAGHEPTLAGFLTQWTRSRGCVHREPMLVGPL